MEKIKKLLDEHYDEFMDIVDLLYDEKYPSKKPKTICFLTVLGKKYNSDIFTKNYKSFLNDITKMVGGKVFKHVLERYVEFNPNDFPKSVIRKNQYTNINNVFYLSTYSSTETKINHVVKLCDYLDIKLDLEYPKTYHSDLSLELQIT